MKIRRKLLVSVLVALFVFLSVVATVAIVFALSRQSVVTNLDMTYTAKDIYGSVKATYKLGAGQEIDLIPVVNGAETGEDKLTFNGEPVANGSLKFPDETLKMSSGAQSVVIKYTFENTGRRHYIATMSFDSSLDFDNMTVQYSQDGIDYSSNRYAVVVQGVENKNQSVTRDYYIKVSIDNPAENASFNGEFIWKLEDCNDNEASYISLPALEFQGSNGSYSASMSSGGGREGEIVFPEEINGDAVETIVSSTLATTQKAEVNKVYIPKSVTKIEDNAFYGFTSLEEVVFEQNEMAAASSVSSQSVAGLIEIGDYAFYDCTSLREIIIPNTVTTIGIHAFENCRTITYLTIPDSVILIGEQAFRRCVSLTDVVLGQNLATFSEDMFLDCPNSINITLPNGNAAYYLEGNCLIEASSKILVKGSNSSIIPNGVTQIGPNAFLGCASLEEVEIPASVTYIDSTAFNYCSGLKTLKVNGSNSVYYSYNDKCIIERSTSTLVKGCATTTIPTDGSVTKIGNYAFIGCSDLTSVTIPAVITSIGYAAYSFCSNLTSLSVDSGNTVYHSAGNCIIQTSNDMLVKGCSTSEIPTDGSVKIIDSFAFTQTNGLTSINIPDSVQQINYAAFYYCGELTTVNFGTGLSWMATAAFKNCSNLTTLTMSGASTKYFSSGNCIIYIPSNKVVLGSNNSIIPTDSSVNRIGEYAFAYCRNLTSIVIPGNISKIEDYAFQDCVALRNLTFENGVCDIGNYAFDNCKAITTLKIPSSVYSIGRYAFKDCYALQDVKFENISGWSISDIYMDVDGTDIDLTCAETKVIAWLTSTVGYFDKYWFLK